MTANKALGVFLALAGLLACGGTNGTGFGDGGGGGTSDGSSHTRSPDGSLAPHGDATTMLGQDGGGPTSKDAGGGAHHDAGAAQKDSGSTSKKDSGATSKKDSGVSPPSGDSGSPTYDAAPPPAVTPCDLCAAAGGTCSNSVCTLSENPGGVSTATQQQLQSGGSADPNLAWLYPYDHTVFPRGILSPTLQFGGTAPDAVWVHITFPEMTYDGYFGASSAPLGGGQAALSSAAWIALEAMATASDTVSVELTKISGGQVSGPISESWSIAQGELRGTIYHETYGSQIIGGAGVGIMKIQPGATAPTPLKRGCSNVCHTASANGSTLVAASGDFNLFASSSYDLQTDASVIHAAGTQIFIYGGLYPDGTFGMSATNYRTWVGGKSRLYDTATGANIPAAGWDDTISNAGTSSFSLDGTQIVFNHEDSDNGAGHTLSLMAFDVTTYTFSGLVDLATDATRTLAWPAWTPDDSSVIYHAGSNAAFETDDTSDAGVGTTGDVYIVDVASKTTARLDALDGYNADGTTYLPANDPDLSFAPTVLPEAVGGYFWVVFTSHRSYGNTSPSKDNDGVNGKLWVSAVNIGGTPGEDSSHPAFFLQGQELTSDNLRGFWVLDPCQANGTACTGGDQCCAGYCEPVGGQYECVASSPTGCSSTMEKCQQASDCCSVRDTCINHLCSTTVN
jgi:hypothetical protein